MTFRTIAANAASRLPKRRAKDRPRSLQNSVATVATATVAVLVLLGVCVASWVGWQRDRRDLVDRALDYVSVVSSALGESSHVADAAGAERLLSGFLADQSVSAAAIISADGSPLAFVGRSNVHSVSAASLSGILAQNRDRIEGARMSTVPMSSGAAIIARLGDPGDRSGHVILMANYGDVDAAAIGDALFLLAEGLITIAAVAIALHRLMGRIVSPLDRLSHAMRDIAAGDLSVEVPDRRRSDEVGELARAVELFRLSLVERQQLQTSADVRRNDEEARRIELDSMICSFRSEIRNVLKQVGGHTEQMAVAADSLSAIARHSNGRAEEAVARTAEASQNVATVARASEELFQSITEIETQIGRAREHVQAAAATTAQTSGAISGLEEKANAIGEIVGLIQAIAAQTNLLALNATIEAARAGSAGRGFAVVAQEVKALAGQTAHATERIAEHVTAIQRATSSSVDAIGSIASTMRQAESFTASIAVAVEEQAAATNEIARSVGEAARGTQSAAGNMRELRATVGETDQSAAQVHQASGDMMVETRRLSETIEQFLDRVAAA